MAAAAAAADKEECGEKMAAEELAAMQSAKMETIKDKAPSKKGSVISQYSVLAILLLYCLSPLVFAEEERG